MSTERQQPHTTYSKKMYIYERTLLRDKCVGSADECQKYTAASFNTAVVYATVIPVVVVLIFLCVIILVLWKRHKKEKLENVDDHEFNGDIEILPELYENPFASKENDEHGGEYDEEHDYDEGADYEVTRDRGGNSDSDSDFYNSLQPPASGNTRRKLHKNGSSGTIPTTGSTQVANDMASAHSGMTRKTSQSNFSHVNTNNLSVDPFQLPILSDSNNHKSMEDLRSFANNYDNGGAYALSKSASPVLIPTVRNSNTTPMSNTLVNPLGPMFQKNPYSAGNNVVSTPTTSSTLNMNRNNMTGKSPLRSSFHALSDTYPSTSDSAETSGAETSAANDADKFEQHEITRDELNQNKNENDIGYENAYDNGYSNPSEHQVETSASDQNLQEANLEDDKEDHVLNTPGEEENIQRLKSIYNVYLDKHGSALGPITNIENENLSEVGVFSQVSTDNSQVHKSPIKHSDNAFNTIAEEEESQQEQHEMDEETESMATANTTNQNEVKEISTSDSKPETIKDDIEQITEKLQPKHKSFRHTSSIYSERAPAFNFNEKEYQTHELPKVDLAQYQDPAAPVDENLQTDVNLIEPQAFQDQYEFDPTSQQYYYFDPVTQYHYYFDPMTQHYYFFEPTTEQYYYIDPMTHEQYFYDIQSHQPYYYDPTQNQYFYLPTHEQSMAYAESPNPQYQLSSHPQAREQLESLPTPSTLIHTNSINSLTSFKPNSRNNATAMSFNVSGRAFNPIDNPEMSFKQGNYTKKSSPLNNSYSGYQGDVNSLAENTSNGNNDNKFKVLPHHLRNSIVMTNPMELGQNSKTFRPAGSFRKNSNPQLFQGNTNRIMMNSGQLRADPRVSTVIEEADLQVPVKLTGTLLPQDFGSKEDLRRQLR